MKIEFSYISLIFLALIFIPNLIWLKNKPKDYEKYLKKEKKSLQIIESIGEISSVTILLLFTNFSTNTSGYRLILLGVAILYMIFYELYWIRYFLSDKTIKDMYRPFLFFQAPGALFPVIALYMLALYAKSPYLAISAIILGIGHVGIHLDHQDDIFKEKTSKKRYFYESMMLLFVTIMIMVYSLTLGKTYEAINVEEYIKSSDTVEVTTNKDGIYFDGEGEDTLLIFYPGANVEYDSYSPLMYKLAEKGIDAYILKLPYNLSFFASNKPNKIINNYKYDNYYIGGHSLGGVTASSYANKHANTIKGIVLLASYPNSKIDNKLSLISIYGSNDGVLNKDNYNKNKSNWPTNSKEYVIEGGNHSGFAFYGLQRKDNKSDITNEEQIDETVSILINEL